MRTFLKNKKNYLIFLGIAVYVTFFISAFSTGWYDYFFFGSSNHYCCRGLDFFAVPNGAYSFFHGGDFSGKTLKESLPYSLNFPSNVNVYHPLFTLIIGSFFLLFQPNTAFYLWMSIKGIVTLAVTIYLYKKFHSSRILPFALFIFLTNFSQYNELKISQYQFVFNIFLLLFLIQTVKDGSHVKETIFFLITLLVKPIGFLWIPVLLVKRQVSVAVVSVLLFFALTVPFIISHSGEYYIQNMTGVFFHPTFINIIDIMNLAAQLRFTFHFSPAGITFIKALFVLCIFSLALSKRISLLKCVFLLIVYFLCFYDFVYQYHFSILAPVLTVGLLTDSDFRSLPAKILILLVNGPNIFFILRLFSFNFIWDPFLGPNPTRIGWELVSISQLLPLLLLVAVIMYRPVRELLLDVRKRSVYVRKFVQ